MRKVGIGVLMVLGIGLLIWLNYALFAGKILGLAPEVRAALQSDDEVEVALLKDDAWLVMVPNETAPTTGMILYPEGHRDIRSYALISREIARQGFHFCRSVWRQTTPRPRSGDALRPSCQPILRSNAGP
jgi:hypothetical protein